MQTEATMGEGKGTGGDWRTSNRRPSSFGGARREPEALEPPTMSRSRVQLASSYAPGVLMTWEGGKGICRAVPLANDISKQLNRTTIDLVFENLSDFATNWRDRAMKAVPDALPELILDAPFRDSRTGEVRIERGDFQMTGPDRVGYVPYPLVYRCGICGSTREYESIADQARQPLPRKCNGHDARWTQIDVVYVHWSGEIQPLSPFNYNFDPQTGSTRQIRMCTCGSTSFKLRNDAPVFSEWRYVCEGCGDTRPLKKAEPEVLSRLQTEQNTSGRAFQWIEINMLPVSYRANSTFYPQRTSFIEFQDSAVVELMTPPRVGELVAKLAQIHNIPFAEPAEDEVRAAVQADPKHRSDWDDYLSFLEMASRADESGRPERARSYRDSAHELREGWFAAGIVERGRLGSAGVLRAITQREDWTRRYNPIRLTIQHDAFLREHIEEAMARHAAVDVMEPDITLTDVVNDPQRKARYQSNIGNLLAHLGMERLVIVRNLPICEFSFGFTRVSATPVYKREHQGTSVDMPVRLKAFDQLPIQGTKRPIYVTQQQNEALYFKLDEARVVRWLQANMVTDVPHDGLGRGYLERYEDFGPFLEMFKDREGSGGYPRTVPAYVYLLLHTLSHQMMHSLADSSGVDRDGIGEHIFPADLAFVIYRKGMTPDLGNISAMWRNHADEFLRRALDPRMLRCGSGSLCDARGGACPACVMVSEVSCIASNLLLSRAVLKGGKGPEWEPRSAPDLVGFFDPAVAK
ncbi:MAG: hypothetical protein E5X54_32980 [Mesorhizobium sp.]|nr:hypothetical protein EOA85_10385 [Mesorhizobium sp. M5C.F.Ca.IN.020.29.1.1]RWK51068.1 MAG: hypothetical protein EOR48_26215 [Mesorhizobium sp.]TIM85347.1 MAG: hypothetical protein E5Y50_19085 [Mesorhizobium sp.]TIP41215.1 MAG: hypothetical protein E5X62_25945 [Mesorhizobium sp.]TIQ24827.1 MAG: hypothetical protein E5X54_32980 [Mesorhizobium sp.]